MTTLDKNFWNERWETNQTSWDVGFATPPITSYFSNIENKELSILIPGCGNAYEAEFLLNTGFKNISILDIAPKATEILREKFKNHPQIKIINENYFDHKGQYDFIIEQTFFCALSPDLRQKYADKTFEILKEKGKIVGVLFNVDFEIQGPPFGGNTVEYQNLFQKHFEIITMENCYNSIVPRKGNEVFIQLKKK